MTLHGQEVGVRDLHDRLSEHLATVEAGSDLVVTRRGKAIARLCPVDENPLSALVKRGLVSAPQAQRAPRLAGVEARGSVSDLVADQRR